MFCTLHIDNRRFVFVLLSLIAGILIGVTGINAVSRAVNAKNSIVGTRVPILMYHSMLQEKSRQGKYVVSPQLFESDLKYIKDHGYTTIQMKDLLDYVNFGKPLPEKPIMITFDDGYYNNYVYAYPLIKKYNCKIVISPIGINTDKFSETNDNHANYSHLTWTQINEMMDSGYVEFQNHTYNLHASSGKRIGTTKQRGESTEHYSQVLKEDLEKMQQEMKANTGYTPTTFVFPFGAVSDDALPVIKSLGFQATLTCYGKINIINRNPECLYGMGRFIRPAGTSTENFFAKKLKLL